MNSHARSELDLYSSEVLLDPYPHYRALRDQAAAVWLDKYEVFALSRDADVRAALADAPLFCSGQGVAMNPRMNEALKGGLLCSDAPRHDVLRAVIERPLTPKAIGELRARIVAEADALADRVVAKGTIDVASELAPYLPVTIVADLVGLPEEGRERMLDWAAATFNCLGPMNAVGEAAMPIVGEMIDYAFTQCVPEKLKPDGWAAMIWQAADRGEIEHSTCPFLMNDYMGPALDTTIFAISSAIWLFARHPDQWDIIRDNPALAPQAINEVLRMESPIQGFSRVLTRDHAIEGVEMPAGTRAIVLYGSANRDERKWADPERFDVRRPSSQEHLAFGLGEHRCVGNNLARAEMRALLAALAKRVRRFELHEASWRVNNILRGLGECRVTLH